LEYLVFVPTGEYALRIKHRKNIVNHVDFLSAAIVVLRQRSDDISHLENVSSDHRITSFFTKTKFLCLPNMKIQLICKICICIKHNRHDAIRDIKYKIYKISCV